MTKTIFPHISDIKHKWYLIDATNNTVGDVAVKAATILRGKHKVDYTPHLMNGDCVIVTNIDKVRITGNKLEAKKYYNYSGYRSGLKEIKMKDLMVKDPQRIISDAVKRMLPANRHRNKLMKQLRPMLGTDHKMDAQNPIEIKL